MQGCKLSHRIYNKDVYLKSLKVKARPSLSITKYKKEKIAK